MCVRVRICVYTQCSIPWGFIHVDDNPPVHAQHTLCAFSNPGGLMSLDELLHALNSSKSAHQEIVKK